MPRPVAVHVSVSMSPPGRGIILGDRHGRVIDRPDWVSLDGLVAVQLDDGTRVSTPEPTYGFGGPLGCSRRELEERVNSSVLNEPLDAGAEPHPLVRELQTHGIDTTQEALAALPRTITLSSEVEARLEHG